MTASHRRAQIIDVAQELMVDQGYGAVTLRAVAAGCDVSLAAIQHFYPEKASLFDAMIENIISSYHQSYVRIIEEAKGTPEDRLRQFLRFLVIDDIKSRRTAGFFYELWNLAHRNPGVAEAMARLYHGQLDRFKEFIIEARPNIDEAEALRRGAVVMAANDGLMLTIGYGKSAPKALCGEGEERIVEIMIATALHGHA